jgi:hypothetical protein
MGTKEKKPARASGQRPKQRLKRAMLVDLYEARQFLTLDTIKETGLRMPVQVYFKDPAVAETTAVAGIDSEFTTAICDRKRNCYVAPDRKTALDGRWWGHGRRRSSCRSQAETWFQLTSVWSTR